MLILALDTTTPGGSIAVADGPRLLAARAGDPALTHAQRLPLDLVRTCERAGRRLSEVELLAVAAGPGSFTGLRIGIATMQGLAVARRLRIVPVSALEALAASASGPAARVASWMDAHRGEVFAQVFERRADPSVHPVAGPVAGTPERVLEEHGAFLDEAAFHGEGAVRYADRITRNRPAAVIAATVPLLAPAIAALAAHDPARAVLPHAVIPIYVRRPDAEIARERRNRS